MAMLLSLASFLGNTAGGKMGIKNQGEEGRKRGGEYVWNMYMCIQTYIHIIYIYKYPYIYIYICVCVFSYTISDPPGYI